ncbi:TIGR03936 family radical SAM-associated protein [Clostridium aquiflavi]|uniref:TIGR03936 family radical SAM-associated protein n=1 Tax=Clostridium aquiflavi TaxID=3073603 RepID=A0ABU1ECP6_9CLOT|nr:TIGR03936 family radical SAM-associated protein [Clostridium sp. 5N-1]MDR5586152.1 TIGR03936 family radical SAM-associated protein [Clostridium sp. 5N-1]
MRYLIKYTKEANVKFISHLDLMRTIQKNIRRAELPMEYSKGFNPHMTMSIAQPLAVGVYSDGEYMDLVFAEEMNEKEIIDRLNSVSSSGIKFKEATKIPYVEGEKKVPQGMALIDAARYTAKVPYENTENLENEVNELLNKNEWKTIKKSKKGEKEVDIKTMIREFKFWIKDDYLVINMVINSGSREHLAPELVVKYIQERTSNVKTESFVDIKREEMYFLKGERLLPLYKALEFNK